MDLEYSMYCGISETGEKVKRKKMDDQIFKILKGMKNGSGLSEAIIWLVLISIGTIPKEIDFSGFLIQ